MLHVFAAGAAIFAFFMNGCGSKHSQKPATQNESQPNRDKGDHYSPYMGDPMEKFHYRGGAKF